MNRLYFSFEDDDEYFAKTTEIDNYDKAIITAIFPHIKLKDVILPSKIIIGNQAPNDETEYVIISKEKDRMLQISERQSFKRGYTGFTYDQCERIFIENCAGVEYYGVTYDLAKKLNYAFANDGVKYTDSKDWFDKQQEIMKHTAEEASKELLKTITSETPKFNDLSFNVISDVCDEILSTLKKKNDDYGNSYIKNIERFGKQAMLIPMFNKLDRLESLSKKENQNFESFEDSLRDLTGYCLMAIQHLIKTRGK